ncbi:hypothetical protein PR003_g19906 [Phytophthora rubi]|uniref:Uncharacterized protein n=1 Tax=Phytophthora rubi TaxID=129364 RepID=A0A6A4DRL6_9STRA|nr:hypothetical protein PR003_g19906 [Phytophthora rubi]
MSKRRASDLLDSSDEEGSYEHPMPVPIFTPILPPKLRSISHEELVKWDKRRREYEAKMRARCRSSGEDYNLVTQNVKESFDVELLESFCSLRLRKDVADVTEGQLIAEIKALLAKVNNDLPDIKALFDKELVMDLAETDVDARILAYFQKFEQVVLEHGLEDVFSGDDGEKEKCKRLVSCLAPPVLKADAKTAVRWTDKAAAKSMQKLYTLVYDKAVAHERHVQQDKRMRMTARVKDKSKDSSASTMSGRATGTAAQPKKQGRGDFSVKPTAPKNDRKCQEIHWLSDCPKASDAEKVALRLKLREAAKARGSRVKRLKRLMPAASRTVTINGVLELPCCPDSGSDHTVISRSHWDLLIAADPNTQALLHVLIHTAAGPVEPAEAVPCLVVDMDDDEFIIGRDLLGIDVDRQLEQLATHRDDETSGDPFSLEADEPPAERQAATDDEVRAAVEVRIERALQHGFPPDKVDKLRLIVFAYDVWRLELRDDPPARCRSKCV